uniref:C-type lectin domain-containing protein n=1 Tax=Xiphophorus couchianus TaxID=32473 RepID=A0A3B5L642_9TELE
MEKSDVEKQNECVQKTHDTTGKIIKKRGKQFIIIKLAPVFQFVLKSLFQRKRIGKELRKDKKNLTELIKNMEETWNELNVSRAQWSIDAYCPKKNGGRNCTYCPSGWNYNLSSCYAYNDAKPSDQRNWEGAREDCKTKKSDLTVVSNNAEKDYVKTQSPATGGITGFWIGLRAVEGKWKWLDGSDLTNQAWIQQPATDGKCVTSLQNREWTSVNCTERNAWICEKKALSV